MTEVSDKFRLSVTIERIDGRNDHGYEMTTKFAELTVPVEASLAFRIYLDAAARAVAPSPVYVRQGDPADIRV